MLLDALRKAVWGIIRCFHIFCSLLPHYTSSCARRMHIGCRGGGPPRKSRRKVPIVARYEEDAWRRWQNHKVFPRSLLLQLLAVCLVTAQIVYLNRATANYSHNMHHTWAEFLFPDEAEEDWAGNELIYPNEDLYFLHRSDQLEHALDSVFKGYFGIQPLFEEDDEKEGDDEDDEGDDDVSLRTKVSKDFSILTMEKGSNIYQSRSGDSSDPLINDRIGKIKAGKTSLPKLIKKGKSGALRVGRQLEELRERKRGKLAAKSSSGKSLQKRSRFINSTVDNGDVTSYYTYNESGNNTIPVLTSHATRKKGYRQRREPFSATTRKKTNRLRDDEEEEEEDEDIFGALEIIQTYLPPNEDNSNLALQQLYLADAVNEKERSLGDHEEGEKGYPTKDTWKPLGVPYLSIRFLPGSSLVTNALKSAFVVLCRDGSIPSYNPICQGMQHDVGIQTAFARFIRDSIVTSLRTHYLLVSEQHGPPDSAPFQLATCDGVIASASYDILSGNTDLAPNRLKSLGICTSSNRAKSYTKLDKEAKDFFLNSMASTSDVYSLSLLELEKFPISSIVYFPTLKAYETWKEEIFIDEDDVAELAQSMEDMYSNVQARSFNVRRTELILKECVVWNVNIRFSMANRGGWKVWIDDSYDGCDNSWAIRPTLFWLPVVSIAIAILRQLIFVRDCSRAIRLMLWTTSLGASARFFEHLQYLQLADKLQTRIDTLKRVIRDRTKNNAADGNNEATSIAYAVDVDVLVDELYDAEQRLSECVHAIRKVLHAPKVPKYCPQRIGKYIYPFLSALWNGRPEEIGHNRFVEQEKSNGNSVSILGQEDENVLDLCSGVCLPEDAEKGKDQQDDDCLDHPSHRGSLESFDADSEDDLDELRRRRYSFSSSVCSEDDDIKLFTEELGDMMKSKKRLQSVYDEYERINNMNSHTAIGSSRDEYSSVPKQDIDSDSEDLEFDEEGMSKFTRHHLSSLNDASMRNIEAEKLPFLIPLLTAKYGHYYTDALLDKMNERNSGLRVKVKPLRKAANSSNEDDQETLHDRQKEWERIREEERERERARLTEGLRFRGTGQGGKNQLLSLAQQNAYSVYDLDKKHKDSQHAQNSARSNFSAQTTNALLGSDIFLETDAQDEDPGPVSLVSKKLCVASMQLHKISKHIYHIDALSLLPFWSFVGTLSNVFCILYCFWCIYEGEIITNKGGQKLLAYAGFLEWALISQYLRHRASTALFCNTAFRVGPSIWKNAVASLPIFFSYCFFSLLVLGRFTERFDGPIWSSVTLFSMANGDVIRECFKVGVEFQWNSFLKSVSQIILYSFCLLFIVALIKISGAMTEEAYLWTKPQLPGEDGKVDLSKLRVGMGALSSGVKEGIPEVFRLPPRIRAMLTALNSVRVSGGSLKLLVRAAESFRKREEATMEQLIDRIQSFQGKQGWMQGVRKRNRNLYGWKYENCDFQKMKYIPFTAQMGKSLEDGASNAHSPSFPALGNVMGQGSLDDPKNPHLPPQPPGSAKPASPYLNSLQSLTRTASGHKIPRPLSARQMSETWDTVAPEGFPINVRSRDGSLQPEGHTSSDSGISLDTEMVALSSPKTNSL